MKNFLPFVFLIGFYLTAQSQDFNMKLRSHVPYPGYTCSSEWGYVDNHGNEYALVGTSFGVSIVNITDPDNPQVTFNIQHTSSFWREIKTYGNYAYATNEDGGGLLVMDLSNLPDTVYQYSFIYTDPNGYQQTDGHELWIDEHGRLYIFGGAYWNAGATMFDLTADPINPPFLGAYENHYIHSGFVRGDTLWASEIFDGQVEVVNVADPQNCMVMSSFTTPNHFTHNSWPTHDDHYLFTTDEVAGAYVTAYDVSDLNNVTEVDRIQSNPGTSVIPHNVHLLTDTFAVTAYYCDGVVVFDVSHPDNMIKVASYDTWPNACVGYNGTWGAYPYLPSGNLILSNIEDGLFVLTPTYIQACRLEGFVTDSATGTPLYNVNVQILNTGVMSGTDLSGNYKTGYAYSGNYNAEFTYAGYATRIIPVTLNHGQVTALNVKMKAAASGSLHGTVIDSSTGIAISASDINIADSSLTNYTAVCDVNGQFSVPNTITTGDYLATAGIWGYKTRQEVAAVNDVNSSIVVPLPKGFYDDFFFDNSWIVSGTATSGSWVRGAPVGTNTGGVFFNPSSDANDDYGSECYVTGNNGGNPGDDDLQNGYTMLTSPLMDLSGYLSPKISFEYWLATDSASATNDSLMVLISNGNTTVQAEAYSPAGSDLSQWLHREIRVKDLLTVTSQMSVSFYAVDHAGNNVFEVAIDRFDVNDSTMISGIPELTVKHYLNVFPNPFSDVSQIQYDLSSLSNKNFSIEIYNVIGKKMNEIHPGKVSGSITLRNNFTDGVYMVRLIAEGKMIDQVKVVKTH